MHTSEETLVDVTPLLKKRVQILWSIANIATLVGLLGTVIGLIRAFGAVAAAKPEERSALLAKGISEALSDIEGRSGPSAAVVSGESRDSQGVARDEAVRETSPVCVDCPCTRQCLLPSGRCPPSLSRAARSRRRRALPRLPPRPTRP